MVRSIIQLIRLTIEPAFNGMAEVLASPDVKVRRHGIISAMAPSRRLLGRR
ncbi:MAG: hypothetical protein ACUVWZ_13400 [Anaerolineae bacterium]